MDAYINKKTLMVFKGMMKNVANDHAIALQCSKRKWRFDKLDLDSNHRSLRIMAKAGYLYAEEKGDKMWYTLSPKGLALYDSITLKLS